MVLFAIILFVFVATVVASPANACTEPQKLIDGTCPEIGGYIAGSEATIEADASQDGGGSSEGRTEYGAEKIDNADPGIPFREPFTATGLTEDGPVTLADIASFRPDTGGAGMEPNGWMVTGLDTNFYSSAAPHTVDGDLLGFAASVRFTPRAWHWDYGDGAARTTSVPGATWAALRVAEFDPTPTSHVYSASGTVTIDLAVEFGAEYRVGEQDWTAIDGTLNVPAARFTATAGGARTVLVARDCLVNPRGPGC